MFLAPNRIRRRFFPNWPPCGEAAALGLDVKRFAVTFTVVFAFAYASWIIGSYAYVAAVTPADQQKFGIGWSLGLTNEGAYIFALIAGLIIASSASRVSSAFLRRSRRSNI